MIDIHCHILCGLDDGASDMDESLSMARIAVADGITDIIATPHFTKDHTNDRIRVERQCEQLQTRLNEAHIPLVVHPGNEVRLENKAFVFERAEQFPFAYLDKHRRYLLMEQRWESYDSDTPDIIKWFKTRGTRVIMPHPERHHFFRSQPELLGQLIKEGVWTQVTADSLIGNNGDDIRQFAEWMVQQNWVHTLATDAHNIRRKPNLSGGFEAVRSLAGQARVDEIHSRMRSILFEH